MTQCDATVVIPTHNRWEVLRRSALASALAQEDVDVEVVVVDDGSSDGTAERLAELDDPRLRVVRHPRPLGVAHARNAGLAVARGRWVSFLDDDDLWAPLKLRRQIDAGEAVGASLVYTAGAAVDAERRFLFAVAQPEPERVARALLRWNVIWCGCSNVAAPADVLRRLGGFDERLFQLADWDLWIRLTEAGRAAACPEALVAYILHEGNIHLDQSDLAAEARHLAAKHAGSSLPGVLDRADLDSWAGWTQLRRGRHLTAARLFALAAVRGRRAGYLPAMVSALLQRAGLRAPVPRELTPPDWLARVPSGPWS